MKKGGGKNKGSSFERDTCRRLSLWITFEKEEDAFWRSSMSGGRSTVALKKGKNLAKQAGDISATSEIGHKLTNKFLLECKHYASLDLHNVLFNANKGNLLNFWNRLVRDSETYGKFPMLVAKQNRLPTLVCLSKEGYQLFNPSNTVVTHAVHCDMYVMDFEDFLNNTDPVSIF